MSERSEYLRAHARKTLPIRDGRLLVGGMKKPVEIVYDAWGVAHIFAQTIHDLYFAQGFSVASERLYQVDVSLRAASGRLAELLGESLLEADKWHRTTGSTLAMERVKARTDDLSREIGHAWLAGVHACIERMPARPLEYELLGIDPELPAAAEGEYLLGGSWQSAFIPFNIDMELLRTALVDKVGWEAMLLLCPGNPPQPSVVTAGKTWGSGRRTAMELLQ